MQGFNQKQISSSIESLRNSTHTQGGSLNLKGISEKPPTLAAQEIYLQNLWKVYSEYSSRFGETAKTKKLRDEYFKQLRLFRKNKEWHEIL